MTSSTPTAPHLPDAGPSSHSLRELAHLFLKLGTVAFGGPAAHIAMMEDEVVRRRRWLPREEFLDLLGATNLIPGPNSTELAIHIGHRRAGWRGLLVAGVCFILPATLIVAVIAALYGRYGKLPEVDALLYGVKPVIIAVVVQALLGLTRTAVRSPFLAIVALAAVAANLAGGHELLVLVAAAVVVMAARLFRPGPAAGAALLATSGASAPLREAAAFTGSTPAPHASFAAGAAALAGGVAAAVPVGLGPLFLFFLKVGSVLFGSGYVLLAFLRADLVERFGWLTEAQLLDAVAVGQITPGPVFTTATFIGHLVAGPAGAVVATIGIFLPAFVFVALSGPLVPRLRRWPAAGAFLDGLNVASLALMAVVTLALGRAALVDLPTVALAAVAAVLLVRFQVNSAWLVAGGALLGTLIR
jgi:chromate transporter